MNRELCWPNPQMMIRERHKRLSVKLRVNYLAYFGGKSFGKYIDAKAIKIS